MPFNLPHCGSVLGGVPSAAQRLGVWCEGTSPSPGLSHHLNGVKESKILPTATRVCVNAHALWYARYTLLDFGSSSFYAFFEYLYI